jgi:hypothetical protein
MATTGLERGLYRSYIATAQKKRVPVPFELSIEEFLILVKQNCYICGMEPSQAYWKSRGDILIYNGIDRIDNTKGYVSGNCKACCKKCNSVKSDMGLSDLKDHLVRMLRGLGVL